MKATDLNLGEQLKMSEREIRRRLELLSIGPKEKKEMVGMKPLIAPHVETLVDRFYTLQVEEPEIARLIGDSETLSRLKKHLSRYILTLFDGEYGMEYVLSRLRIGMVHKRIGVPPKLYVPSLWNLFSLLRHQILLETDQKCGVCSDRLNALEKIMLFDLALVFDTYIFSLMDALARGRQELEEYAESLEETVARRTQELASLASKDGLTGLLNQRSFYEELRRETARILRIQGKIALLYLDLDGFKKVNDTLGHQQGDDILIAVSDVIRTVVRSEDIAARYGGDEFCILLPHSGVAEAREVAQRLAQAFARQPRLTETGVAFSIGIAAENWDNLRDGDLLVQQADAAMYLSKKIPGHAVTVAGQEAEPLPGD
ncbi:GGDEF domain-containing protein [Thiovibrio frasassiensis]|uniref:Diguanylate cyclase DosC n=1 Tax=Thiovibrio frasassiensis TaxID=2984131 RepID=A0A9X4MCY2_9BACT|nr:GGDEF domain-containing protein [Thiovibrio frasassiensis]MDG4475319.1 GGDEF domain-containing protein [Thiovibrio frasassiensis]